MEPEALRHRSPANSASRPRSRFRVTARGSSRNRAGFAVLLACTLLPWLAGCKGTAEPGEDPKTLPGIAREGDPDFSWYSKYVTVENQKIRMSKNFAGNRMVIFSGVIENGGEKALDLVEVELILFNFEEPVYSEVRVPITPTSRYTPPLEPLSSRAFTLYMEDFPKQWRASSAEVAIHGFRFQPGPGVGR